MCPFNNTAVPKSGGCQNNRPNAVLDGGHTSAAITTAKVQQNTASIRISSPFFFSNKITTPVIYDTVRLLLIFHFWVQIIFQLNASHAAARRLFDNVWTCLRCSHAAERGSRRGR